MSPCTLTWWELPMIQSVRYSTSLFRNFISCRNVSSSRRLIICTRKWSTTRVSSHSCRSQRSHFAWVRMDIITSIKQLSAALSFYSIPPTTFSPHPALLFLYPEAQLFLLVYTPHPDKAFFFKHQKFGFFTPSPPTISPP